MLFSNTIHFLLSLTYYSYYISPFSCLMNMLIPISVNPKNTLVHISLYILLQARGIAKTKSSKTSCQSTHQNRQMYHQNLQMCRNLRGTLQHVARIRPLFGPHRTLEPLDLRLHGVLGNVREMFT